MSCSRYELLPKLSIRFNKKSLFRGLRWSIPVFTMAILLTRYRTLIPSDARGTHNAQSGPTQPSLRTKAGEYFKSAGKSSYNSLW